MKYGIKWTLKVCVLQAFLSGGTVWGMVEEGEDKTDATLKATASLKSAPQEKNFKKIAAEIVREIKDSGEYAPYIKDSHFEPQLSNILDNVQSNFFKMEGLREFIFPGLSRQGAEENNDQIARQTARMLAQKIWQKCDSLEIRAPLLDMSYVAYDAQDHSRTKYTFLLNDEFLKRCFEEEKFQLSSHQGVEKLCTYLKRLKEIKSGSRSSLIKLLTEKIQTEWLVCLKSPLEFTHPEVTRFLPLLSDLQSKNPEPATSYLQKLQDHLPSLTKENQPLVLDALISTGILGLNFPFENWTSLSENQQGALLGKVFDQTDEDYRSVLSQLWSDLSQKHKISLLQNIGKASSGSIYKGWAQEIFRTALQEKDTKSLDLFSSPDVPVLWSAKGIITSLMDSFLERTPAERKRLEESILEQQSNAYELLTYFHDQSRVKKGYHLNSGTINLALSDKFDSLDLQSIVEKCWLDFLLLKDQVGLIEGIQEDSPLLFDSLRKENKIPDNVLLVIDEKAKKRKTQEELENEQKRQRQAEESEEYNRKIKRMELELALKRATLKAQVME